MSKTIVKEYFRGTLYKERIFETEDEAMDFIDRNDEPGVEWVVVPLDD